VIVAGLNCVAVDSVGAQIMGFDPTGDYPDHPFHYRRNVIKLAAEMGFGPNDPAAIEVIGVSPEEVRLPFKVNRYEGDTGRDGQIRRGADCVSRYRDRQDELADRYRGRYLALTDGEVLWDGEDMGAMRRLEQASGRDWQSAPQFVIRCLSPEEEIEALDWYEVEAARLPATSA
jgi:hypothetical protein